MAEESTHIGRDEFVSSLQQKLKDVGFRTDMQPLLLTGLTYDPDTAAKFLQDNLLNLLPE